MAKLLIIYGFLALIGPAHAAEVDITYGQLRHTAPYATQVIAAKNNGAPIETLVIECGFFQGGNLLAAAKGLAQNVAAGQTVYIEVIGTYAERADKADCRVTNIIRRN